MKQVQLFGGGEYDISCMKWLNEWRKHITLSAFHPPPACLCELVDGCGSGKITFYALPDSTSFQTAQLSPSCALCYNSITEDLMRFPASVLLPWPISPSTHQHRSSLYSFKTRHPDPSHTSARSGWIWLEEQDWLLLLRMSAVRAHNKRGALPSNRLV